LYCANLLVEFKNEDAESMNSIEQLKYNENIVFQMATWEFHLFKNLIGIVFILLKIVLIVGFSRNQI
jgi:hypothetical protein